MLHYGKGWFGSNYNIFLFILAIESIGQMNWQTGSKGAPVIKMLCILFLDTSIYICPSTHKKYCGCLCLDPATKVFVDRMAAELDALRRELVGETLVTLDGERASCRLKECNLGNYEVF